MRGFIVSRADNQSIPTVLEVRVAEDDPPQFFEVGALGTLVDGEFVEATSPVTAAADVTHVTETPYGAPVAEGPFAGFGNIGGRREFPPGKALVTDATKTNFRVVPLIGELETLEDVLPENPGGLYSAIRGEDGFWRLDFGTPGPWEYLRTIWDLPGEEGPKTPIAEVEVRLGVEETGGGE